MSDVLREVLLPRLDGVRKSGAGFMARCPAHEDRQASLSLAPGKEQPVAFKCMAGCEPDQILNRLGLSWPDVLNPRTTQQTDGEWTPAGPAIAIYDYVAETGQLLFQVLRTATKDFRQRRPDPNAKNGWAWNLNGVTRVLYRLPKVLEAVQLGTDIWIVEGEKDVQTLEAHGLVATCNAGGAGKWQPNYTESLRGASTVWIVADRDAPGQAHARMVRDALEAVGVNAVYIVEARTGKDATDHLAAHSIAEFDIIYDPNHHGAPELAPDLWEFITAADEPFDWVIPGILERGDRLILTGFEGLGKSMLLRQLAVQTAAGLHPFDYRRHDECQPRRVLYIDCENSERQSRRKFRPLAESSIYYRQRVPDGGLRLIHKPEGIDLTKDEWAAWLLERVTAHRPDLLIVGPFYRLHEANMNEEQPARTVAAVLDRVRASAGCALITEAHAGHGDGKTGDRSVRPIGSSLLLRWPEFGLGLKPETSTEPDANGRPTTVRLQPWRGGRDDRAWPAYLTRGGPSEWPWVPALHPTVEEPAA